MTYGFGARSYTCFTQQHLHTPHVFVIAKTSTNGIACSSMQARGQPSIGRIPKKQRKQLDDSFDQAKAKLDSQRGQGPFVLASKVPQSVFDAWDDDSKAAWGIAYNSSTQSILMYGDTGWVHAYLQGYFLQEFLSQLHESMDIAGLSDNQSSYEQRSSAQDELGVKEGFRSYGRTTMYTTLGAKSQMQASTLLVLVPDPLSLRLHTGMRALRLCVRRLLFGMQRVLDWP